MNNSNYISLSFWILISFCNILFCNAKNFEERYSADSTKKQSDLVLIASYQRGPVSMTNDFVKGNNLNHIKINSFQTGAIHLSRQTTGVELWEQLYKFPQYGFGISTTRFVNSSETGQPITVYGLLSFPMNRWKNLSLNLDFGIGFSFNWESYSENPYNIALGAKESAYVDIGPSLESSFDNGLLLDIGASFTHFSNGALKKPNFGINSFAPKVSLGYYFNGKKKAFNYQKIPEFQKKSECVISFFRGWENEIYKSSEVDSVIKIYGTTYSVFGLSATFNRQISYKSKFGMGFMVDYSGAANPVISVVNGKLEEKHAPFKEGLELSIFPSYELVINRFSIVAQEGIYIYRAKYSFLRAPSIYQRLGFKYDVCKDFTVGANLRFYQYNISHYIEWTVGYRLHLLNHHRKNEKVF